MSANSIRTRKRSSFIVQDEEEEEGEVDPGVPPTRGPSSFIPKVFVRIRPPTNPKDSTIEVCPDGKCIKLHSLSNQNDEYDYCKPPPMRTFVSDGILISNHEETFKDVAEDLIEGAMNGNSGVILSLGLENSGKSLEFYGDLTKYETRGILPRSFEKIFEYADIRKDEIKYTIRMGMIEICNDSIHDLITLSPNELKVVGDNGPMGMFMHEIRCPEHGLALLIRGITGQRLMSERQYSKLHHTMVFLDIVGEEIPPELPEDVPAFCMRPHKFESRITFAKFASIPPRINDLLSMSPNWIPPTFLKKKDSLIQSDGCSFFTPVNTDRNYPNRPQTAPLRVSSMAISEAIMTELEEAKEKKPCCKRKDGYVRELFSVRRDFMFLHQMFIKVAELQRLYCYYQKLVYAGMEGNMRKPNLAPSQYLRQSRLCHCLRDLVCCAVDIRVFVHLRPESVYIPNVNEAIHFVQALRHIQPEIKADLMGYSSSKMADLNSLKAEIECLREELNKISKANNFEEDASNLTQDKLQHLQSQAIDFLEGRIDNVEIGSKTEAKIVFENVRELVQSGDVKPKSRGSKGRLSKSRTSIINGQVGNEEGRKKSSMNEAGRKKSSVMIDVGGKKSATGEGGKKSLGKKNSNTQTTRRSDSSEHLEEIEMPLDQNGGAEGDIHSESAALLENIAKIMSEPSLPLTKSAALIEFEKIENGAKLSEEVKFQESILEKITSKCFEDVREASELVKSISMKQAELDAIQQERHINGDEYDAETGNVIVSQHEKELVTNLKTMRAELEIMTETVKEDKIKVHEQKKLVDAAKNEFETQFQIFFLERTPGSRVSQGGSSAGVETFEHKEFCSLFGLHGNTPSTGGMPMEFEKLKRLAQAQAKAILKYYRTRPVWRV